MKKVWVVYRNIILDTGEKIEFIISIHESIIGAEKAKDKINRYHPIYHYCKEIQLNN